MDKMQELLAVQTSEGSFSSERAVVVQLSDGREVSLFADRGLVDQRKGQDFLKVVVVKTDPSAQTKTVLLPSETFETMSRWATVPQDRVVVA
jgi:hypothetical protein